MGFQGSCERSFEGFRVAFRFQLLFTELFSNRR